MCYLFQRQLVNWQHLDLDKISAKCLLLFVNLVQSQSSVLLVEVPAHLALVKRAANQ